VENIKGTFNNLHREHLKYSNGLLTGNGHTIQLLSVKGWVLTGTATWSCDSPSEQHTGQRREWRRLSPRSCSSVRPSVWRADFSQSAWKSFRFWEIAGNSAV